MFVDDGFQVPSFVVVGFASVVVSALAVLGENVHAHFLLVEASKSLPCESVLVQGSLSETTDTSSL